MNSVSTVNCYLQEQKLYLGTQGAEVRRTVTRAPPCGHISVGFQMQGGGSGGPRESHYCILNEPCVGTRNWPTNTERQGDIAPSG